MEAAAGRMERIRNQERARARLPLRVVFVFGLVLAAAIVCVWTQQQTNATAYALHDAHERLRAAELEHGRLSRELAARKSPQRLGLQAPRFHLAEPKPEQVRRVP